MNVVDSSGWLAYFLDEPNAERFQQPILATDQLIVPSIVVLEVFRHIRRSLGVADAIEAAAIMRRGRVEELTDQLAILAAELSVEHKLPLADSVVLATCRDQGAVLWTQDSDFEGLEDVVFLPRA